MISRACKFRADECIIISFPKRYEALYQNYHSQRVNTKREPTMSVSIFPESVLDQLGHFRAHGVRYAEIHLQPSGLCQSEAIVIQPEMPLELSAHEFTCEARTIKDFRVAHQICSILLGTSSPLVEALSSIVAVWENDPSETSCQM